MATSTPAQKNPINQTSTVSAGLARQRGKKLLVRNLAILIQALSPFPVRFISPNKTNRGEVQ